uniref:NADH dehydrogenase subunit 5 n=1 Tax=Cymoninus sechellensis TaxID=3103804 RepID=UPI002E75EF54|nr:NADH dehydrogenase subunit 5 [Cymoninus sechellensis]WPW49242.1 NADH dehydrogenase subunit 5 [Cymoninus sechellensis]
MNNSFIFYKFWFFNLFFLGMSFYLLGMYFLSMNYTIIFDWYIMDFNSCSVIMTLLFDWMSMMFMGSVLLISSMVIYYSFSYMILDVFMNRFLYLVLFFILSMCLMILSPNLISILLGWDGLGLVSYCLVIYFNNMKSFNAGMLTIMTNRIGDVGILLSIAISMNFGSFYFMYYMNYLYSWSLMLYILIILASFTKSAQIPFSSWLPAAMAAPTPVSALVHSSTLVTAGVYLLIRFNVNMWFDNSLFLLISILTMFMSGLGANYEYDLKKIIALSTLSQLGLMMSILFMNYPIMSFFHLLTHAFFKALLFLCAGLYIHCVNNTQDIRYMSGLFNSLPFTSSCFMISNISLCGLPFMSGFYSKDMIVENMMMSYYNIFICLLFYISIGLTACYTMRLIYFIMFKNMNFLFYGSYSEDINMNISMIFLAFMGIMKGSMLSWFLFPYPNLIILPFLMKMSTIMFIIMGFMLGYLISSMNYSFNLIMDNFMIHFYSMMWFMPSFSTYMLYSKMSYISLYYITFLEYSWGEFLVSKSSMLYFIYLSKINTYIQNNNIKLFFIIFMMFSILILMV